MSRRWLSSSFFRVSPTTFAKAGRGGGFGRGAAGPAGLGPAQSFAAAAAATSLLRPQQPHASRPASFDDPQSAPGPKANIQSVSNAILIE